ncbi:MAG: hypothetical protein HRU75_03075 [Planctomycetia bacterium]|nr:MAG: hypothetical protein HRU75_03075 [Planctomycetia bacterium]
MDFGKIKSAGVRARGFLRRAAGWTAVFGIAAGAVPFAGAAPIPFPTLQSSPYLLIGMGPENAMGGQPGVGQAVNVNNFELGANKAPVPSTSGFLNGGSSGGPGLLGNVPNIPLNAKPVGSGICYGGNIAITSPGGVFNLQDVGVYGDLGVRAARSLPGANAGTQNSFFNDPNHFPNTFTSTGFTNPGVNHNTGGFGNDVNPGAAVQSTRMDAPNYAGVMGGVDHSPLRNELANARAVIGGLASTGTINLSGSGGVINSATTINLSPGLNVIDLVAGGSDISLNNANLVIDGPAGSAAIFRVASNSKFLVSNGNILIGNSGIALGSVVFVSDRQDNAQHFNINNAVLNGVAFWTLGLRGGEININNAQGCTQLIADKITLNDVRFCRCAFTPEPGTVLTALLGVGLFASRRLRALV